MGSENGQYADFRFQLRGSAESSSSSQPFQCGLSPASTLDDVSVDDQGNASRITRASTPERPLQTSILRACRRVRRVCPRSAGSQLSPAVNVRLDTPNSDALSPESNVEQCQTLDVSGHKLRTIGTHFIHKEPHSELRACLLSGAESSLRS